MFTVMGITGNVGGAVAENLLAAGKTVRGVVRNPEKAKALADRGVELVQSAYDDAAGLAKAFRGAEGVFAMIPPDFAPAPGLPDQKRTIAAISEALQQANRRILEGLSPLYVGELGLEQSLRTLLRNAQTQAPHLEFSARIDPRLNRIDGLLSQTAYRVMQEGITNVLRHAQATHVEVDAGVDGKDVAIAIADDGRGFAPEQAFGRGLTGMRERVRALDGTFEVVRENGRTLVRCRLPIEQAVDA